MNNSPYKTVQLRMHSFRFFLLEEDDKFYDEQKRGKNFCGSSLLWNSQ